jgi:hypothetical protein
MPNLHPAAAQDGFVPPAQTADDSGFVDAVALSGVNAAGP